MNAHIRVRFAPSPTGHLHIGGARTALFNYLYAKRQGGIFVLRLEDTDIERSTQESVDMILKDLNWLGLKWDEGPEVGGEYGPYKQSERAEIYKNAVEKLINNNQAYYCFCSPAEIEDRRQQLSQAGKTYKYEGTCQSISLEEAKSRVKAGEEHVIRLRVPTSGETIINDKIRGKVVFENKVLDDFILVRSNGSPTYNFAAVVDDSAMHITHIIRGDDHLSNTPKQILVYQALQATLPTFAHVPMILGADRNRLSKRHGATSIGAYAQEGYLPETMINYLALLGWSWDDKTTLFTLNDLENKFSLKRVNQSPAIFDNDKILWMNGVYLRQASNETYINLAIKQLLQAGLIKEPLNTETKAWAAKIVLVVKSKIKKLSEIPEQVSFFWEDQLELTKEAKEKLSEAKPYAEWFKTLHKKLSMLKSFETVELEKVLRNLSEEAGVKLGVLVHPLRVAVTGRINSPGIFEVLELLGQEKVVQRLAAALLEIDITV